MAWPGVFTCLVVDVALRQGPRVAAQVAHALPGQEGGPAEVLPQVLPGDVKLLPHLLPDVLLPCSGQTRVSALKGGSIPLARLVTFCGCYKVDVL